MEFPKWKELSSKIALEMWVMEAGENMKPAVESRAYGVKIQALSVANNHLPSDNHTWNGIQLMREKEYNAGAVLIALEKLGYTLIDPKTPTPG
jgi:hypothetical protein